MEEKNLKCFYPFHSFTIQNGYYNLCCASRQSPVSFNEMGIYDFFYNSDYIKEVRSVIKENKWHPDCVMCKEKEEKGLKSLRLKAADSLINKDPELSYLDVRLSNKCNLGCRMCNEFFSSVIAEEQGIKKTYEWANSALEQIKKIKTLSKIYFTGGEPLLVKENYKLLENLIESNLHRRISLILNTNCTVLPDKFINLILQFQSIHVNLSIDGIGKVQEYIRWPSKWTNVEAVFHQWLKISKENKKIKIVLSPVIQLLNAPYLDEYVEYFGNYINLDTNMDPIVLEQPDYFDLSHAPLFVWEIIEKQKLDNSKIKNILIKKKNSRVDDFWFEHGKTFLQNQDKMRKINLEDYEPYFGFLK